MLKTKFPEYVRACFSGIWIQSHEHDDAVAELRRVCTAEEWTLAEWDVTKGDPLAAIRTLHALGEHNTFVLVLRNYHKFLNSPEILQTLHQCISVGKVERTFIVILSPIVNIPVELEKLFVVINHELPDRAALEEIARGIATEPGEMPEGNMLKTLLDSAVGLTRYEAENAFSLSLVRHGRVIPDSVWEIKTATLKKSGLLTLYRGTEGFSTLGGLAALKQFTARATTSRSELVRPKGVLLLSPPGCGKTAFCKALGAETGRPVLILDIGALMGSLVGQSEERTREALRIIDAMSPCVVMIDEVEKAFAGVGSSSDSGVASRMFGTFLSWLNDHESDVFVVCTANDVSRLPPEFSRAERFDGVFFIDLPRREEKDAIWSLYRGMYCIPEFSDGPQPIPEDENWTGAEIKACCRLAALLEMPLAVAAQNIVPVAVTAAESVERLRTWASGRCLNADLAGMYRRDPDTSARRAVQRKERD